MLFLIQALCIFASLNVLVWPMEGGKEYKPNEFAFMVKVKNKETAVCVGVIDTELTIITASHCLKRVPVPPPYYGNQTTTRKPYEQFVSSLFNPTKNIAIEWVEPGKSTDAPYDGLSNFPEYATVLANAVPPGIKVSAADDLGRIDGAEPTYTRWPMNQSEFNINITEIEATGIVVGMDKAATMKVMTEFACDDRLNSINETHSFMGALEFRLVANDTRDHFCAVGADEDGDFPVGYPCAEDLGAPFIVDGTVWGVLIGAFCGPVNQTALFRTRVRTWRPRRYDGSPTYQPESTLDPNRTYTPYVISSKTPASDAAQIELLGVIYTLTIVVAISSKKNNLLSV